jgi:hypothetical protein
MGLSKKEASLPRNLVPREDMLLMSIFKRHEG